MQQYSVFMLPLPSSFLVVDIAPERELWRAQLPGALFPVGFDAQFYGRFSSHSPPADNAQCASTDTLDGGAGPWHEGDARSALS
jgi:hypothetical protein